MINLFPDLRRKNFVFLNVNEWVRQRGIVIQDQDHMEEVSKYIRKQVGGYPYGGFCEDRTFLWQNTYLKPKFNRAIHLGVDYLVPAGTRVAMIADAVLVDAFDDPDQNGGWGGRLTFRIASGDYEGLYYTSAHLEQPVIKDISRLFRAGKIYARTGHREHNGGWFDHKHDGIFRHDFIETYGWQGFDGYTEHGHKDILFHTNPEAVRLSNIRF